MLTTANQKPILDKRLFEEEKPSYKTLLKKSNVFFLLLIVLFSTAFVPITDKINESAAVRSPAGTVELFFDRLEAKEYAKAASLYYGGGDTRAVEQAGKTGLKLLSVTPVGLKDQLALVKFTALLPEGKHEGIFVLKQQDGRWLILAEPTNEDRRKIEEIIE